MFDEPRVRRAVPLNLLYRASLRQCAKPFVGRYQAVLSRKGVVIARASVRAKG